jgi:D-sedoheptulose 7-phosphate isomerase
MIDSYKKNFQIFFDDNEIKNNIKKSVELIKEISSNRRIFFIGNGGSNSICSHMMEDFAKILRTPTFSFSDPALITCFSNDYGYENAMKEIDAKEKEAQKLLKTVQNTAKGVYQYICFLRYLKVHDQ